MQMRASNQPSAAKRQALKLPKREMLPFHSPKSLLIAAAAAMKSAMRNSAVSAAVPVTIGSKEHPAVDSSTAHVSPLVSGSWECQCN